MGGFLNEEITFDIGHLILLLVLIGFTFFATNRCKLVCSGTEGLFVKGEGCRCPSCMKVAKAKYQNKQLYGCDPNSTYMPYSPQLCARSFKKEALHGCSVLI